MMQARQMKGFGRGDLRLKVFISYRNTILNGKYVNYNLVSELAEEIQGQHLNYHCITVGAETLPRGTLFSPYDIAEFIYKTFLLIDDCDKFCILDKDYFYENGEMTSIWTEAECCIWSYYERKGFLNKHKNKDRYYIIASLADGGFQFRHAELLQLTDYQNFLLRRCALDFDRTSRVDYSVPYLKRGKKLIVVCDHCKECYLVEKQAIPKMEQQTYRCACGNIMDFQVEKKHFVCRQSMHSDEEKKINIFDAIALLYEKESKYTEILF